MPAPVGGLEQPRVAKSTYRLPLAGWMLSPNCAPVAERTCPCRRLRFRPLGASLAPRSTVQSPRPSAAPNCPLTLHPPRRRGRASCPPGRAWAPEHCRRRRRLRLLRSHRPAALLADCHPAPQIAMPRSPSPAPGGALGPAVPCRRLPSAALRPPPWCVASARRLPWCAGRADAQPLQPAPARVVSCDPWPPAHAASSRWLWLWWTTPRARGRACPRECLRPPPVSDHRRSRTASPGCGFLPHRNCRAPARR
mmetsp:Transcript_63352/g.196233  ORF Transcript_63352/g.196233 Transcript_63352/m.196233 type:complete len:252 (-) Transcript_63352:95-850(-)